MGFTNRAVSAMLHEAIGSDKNTAGDDIPVKIALFTDASVPNDDGTGFIEPSNASYDKADAVLKATDGGVVKQYQNWKTIQFNIARGEGWGTIKYVGIYKNGALMFWDELETREDGSYPFVDGNTIPVFDIGELIIGIDRPNDELAPASPVPPID